jgi:hypothetical protein
MTCGLHASSSAAVSSLLGVVVISPVTLGLADRQALGWDEGG